MLNFLLKSINTFQHSPFNANVKRTNIESRGSMSESALESESFLEKSEVYIKRKKLKTQSK